MWDVWDVEVLGMWDVGNVRCYGCGMFGMCYVWNVGCGMWDAGLQNAL